MKKKKEGMKKIKKKLKEPICDKCGKKTSVLMTDERDNYLCKTCYQKRFKKENFREFCDRVNYKGRKMVM